MTSADLRITSVWQCDWETWTGFIQENRLKWNIYICLMYLLTSLLLPLLWFCLFCITRRSTVSTNTHIADECKHATLKNFYHLSKYHLMKFYIHSLRAQFNIQNQFRAEIKKTKCALIIFFFLFNYKAKAKRMQFISLQDYYSRHSAGSLLTLRANALCRCIFICLTYRHAFLMM